LKEASRRGTRQLATFNTTEERLQVIEEIFGITLLYVSRKEKVLGIGQPQVMIYHGSEPDYVSYM
jgi:hypothetical protein